ncbi:MAG: substrate-binding domain-containing protein [Rhodobacteraceae bacterium]|nr:substrate-binding domain-containing protein [Paracoccaceae bacterium]
MPGVGTDHPDITNASRRMKASEWALCNDNGVTEIIGSVIGHDGIVVANVIDGPVFELTREQLFRALSEGQGQSTSWAEIDLSLPDLDIQGLGPPPTSGTRDAFEELVIQAGANSAGLPKDEIGKLEIRTDGPWIDAGENDNLMFKKLVADPDAVSVFDFSFLDQNSDSIKGATIEGIEPGFENIASGGYSVSRSLYTYARKAHVGVVPGIHEFTLEFASDSASGEDGYLVDKGLIPLPEDAFIDNAEAVANLTIMTGAEELK